jgi:hypothetical protein
VPGRWHPPTAGRARLLPSRRASTPVAR